MDCDLQVKTKKSSILQCVAGSAWADGPVLPEALPVLVSGEKRYTPVLEEMAPEDSEGKILKHPD